MKVYPFKITKPNNNALIYQEDIEYIFYDKLHQHDEIQISFIEEGQGTLLIGNSITNYYSGDIFVIGGNIPHAFKSDRTFKRKSKMVSLFFTKSSFGNDFFLLSEFDKLSTFFSNSLHGFQVSSNKNDIIQLFKNLKKSSKFERFLIFLNQLKVISLSKKKLISNFIYSKHLSNSEGERMRKIFEYTIENAHQKISLKEISSIANMTKNAFCKFFKKRTNKTYISFLTELRIENACNILKTNNDLPISEVGFTVGFQNTSNFNRRFKELKKITPLMFRNLQAI